MVRGLRVAEARAVPPARVVPRDSAVDAAAEVAGVPLAADHAGAAHAGARRGAPGVALGAQRVLQEFAPGRVLPGRVRSAPGAGGRRRTGRRGGRRDTGLPGAGDAAARQDLMRYGHRRSSGFTSTSMPLRADSTVRSFGSATLGRSAPAMTMKSRPGRQMSLAS